MADKVIRTFETWIANTLKSSYGYEPEAIRRRLAQAVSMQLTDPFLRQSTVEPLRRKVDQLEALPEQLCCGEMKINTKTGAVAPSFKLLVSCLAKFAALWFFVLWHFIHSLVTKNVACGPATLVHGVPDADLRADGSPKRFEDFCQNGPLDVLSKANRCIVQAARPVTVTGMDKFIYSRFPLLSLFSRNPLRVSEGIAFLSLHLHTIFGYLLLVFRCPISCLLWRDYADHAAVVVLNSKGLIEANVITNTNWLQQFLWMSDLSDGKYKTYMALYSLNSSPLKFKDDPVIANHPGIRHLRADCIWIWDVSYERVLRDEGIFCDTKVVGPILWYLPVLTDPRQANRSNSKRVCLFDVSPQSDEALLRAGMLGNYYRFETAKLFLDDVLATLDEAKLKLGCEIEVLLKHKRIRASIHDQAYFNYVDQLSGPLGKLQVVKEDFNLFSLISESDLIVVIPYSSPAFMADCLDTASIYYDPTGELQCARRGYSQGMFASGKEELVELVKNALSRNHLGNH